MPVLGAAARLAGADGNSSRSKTVTWSKKSDSTLAAHKPPMLAPMTTACPPTVSLGPSDHTAVGTFR